MAGTAPSSLTRRNLGLRAAVTAAFAGIRAARAAADDHAQYPGNAAWNQAVADKVASRTISIGYTPPAASEFYDEIEHGAYSQMKEFTRLFGVKWHWTKFFPGEHQDVNDQVNTIQNWVTNRMDALLVCTAGDFASMQNVYAQAESKGTRVFQFNMPTELWSANELRAISTISYNNAMQAGYLATTYIAEKLGGKGKIILIWGLPGHWSTSRLNGVKLALAKYPGLQIVGQQRGDYVRDKGMNAAQNLLQRNPDINAIYGENEEMALGASQAMDARGMQHWDGKEGVIVIGADGLRSGFQSIKSGQLTATVSVGAVEQGRQSIQTLFWNLVMNHVPPKVRDVDTVVVDRTNVDEPLAYVDWALKTPSI